MARPTRSIIARLERSTRDSRLGTGCWVLSYMEGVPFHVVVVHNSKQFVRKTLNRLKAKDCSIRAASNGLRLAGVC